MNKKRVSVRAVADYEQAAVDAAVRSMVDALGGIGAFVKAGQVVVLKPNLVIASDPKKCATTHPAVVAAVAKLCREAGAGRVIIADSPGGPYNAGYVRGVYKKCGMVGAAEQSGAELNDDFTESTAEFPAGVAAKKIPVLTVLEKADVIINIAKMKTHTYAGFSAACKNFYGAIPGLVKIEWHQYYQEVNHFADCLIDIQEYFAPKLKLHIIDAIDAMEGPGPTSGTPVHVGLLLASTCYTSADIAVVRLMGEEPRVMPSIARAAARGLVNKRLEIEREGERIRPHINQKYKKTAPSTFSATGKSRFLNWLVRRLFSQRPVISKRKCVGCNKCKEHCPVDAVLMKPRKRREGEPERTYAVFDYDKCIRCFCCQELCPYNLVRIKRPWLVRIMDRAKRRRLRRQAKRDAREGSKCKGNIAKQELNKTS